MVELVCHPATPAPARWRVSAAARRGTGGELVLTYRLAGALAGVRLPEAGPSRREDLLWQHTCCEAFVAREHSTAYHELNFSPSRAWALYAFGAYRERVAQPEGHLDPQITVRKAADGLHLEALVALSRLSPAYLDAPLRIGLTAVIEAANGSRSYWALHHAAGEPDFHRREGFTLRLAAPGSAPEARTP
jgi:hypothetical protein